MKRIEKTIYILGWVGIAAVYLYFLILIGSGYYNNKIKINGHFYNRPPASESFYYAVPSIEVKG